MKIRKPSLPVVGAGYTVIVMGAVTITPKDPPRWLWVSTQLALLVWLMAFAAVTAVLWERYGPTGCRLHEFEASRVIEDAADVDGGDAR